MRAETMRFLAERGLTMDDIIHAAELEQRRSDPTNAERQARSRARKRNGVTVTEIPPKERDQTPSSVPDGTGGEPPNAVKAVFDLGVSVLVAAGKPKDAARSLVGKWRKRLSDPELSRLMMQAQSKTDPAAWLTAAVEGQRAGNTELYDAISRKYGGASP